MDAILRSDPTADRADWRIRIILAVMLGLSPALSAAYKSLGGGESRYTRQDVAAQIGMTGPPGTQNLGYGLSQFINATLPWYKDPGFPDRVYGFNLHVVNENTSAMLDGPMPAYVEDIQAALRIEQSKRITADVAAIVCERTDHFVGDDDYYDELFNPDNTLSTGDMWVRESDWHVAMVFPNSSDNTNIIVGNYNSTINEKFSSHLKQYTLSKRNYTGSWHITKNSVELTYAGPKAGILDERGLLSNNFRSFTDLYKVVFAEYDWRYLSAARSPATNTDDGDKYTKFIKSDSTFLAAMVWSRLVAVDGPEVWSPGTSSGIYGDDGWPELRYNTTVAEATISTTIKPSWGIGIVLGINPALLLFALLCRVLFWSRSPIGDKFGLVSILASVEQQSLGLLQGAGLSGRLKRLVFAGFRPETQGNREESWGSGNIVTVLGTKQLRSGAIQKGTTYS
ncbi:uncharacterized protein KY384_001303 [Bacidia gigantensis]|uniref:uncharacterized protein n=1 Tax=Bacidia gigantensis TaxID=2732470 RepID=UPI001D05A4DA|nr:uncharacterized protein KY384_001303 [Bacidia gigantensis]KAG8533563.1 hypothetical protein KY384_001303 [Bacidia gigantensis]